MDSLIKESYNYECVDDTDGSYKYDFVSVGEKEVPKRVFIQRYSNEGLERYFNLGFANITIDDEGNETISDMSRDNNKNDSDKVLKTVFTCALDFMSVKNNANSILTFYGNTTAKHRLYKSGLNKNLNSIIEYFEIKGGIIHNLEIEEHSGEPKTPISKINVDEIEYELYDVQRCNQYNFITFELKEKFQITN